MTTPAVSASGVVKKYGAVHALSGADLAVSHGEVFALLGPNGAGKTTFVEITEGYRRRTAGEVAVLGVDPQTADRNWRDRIGIVLQSAGLFDDLTVREVVCYFSAFFSRPLDADHVIDLVGLRERSGSRCRTLSGGQRRRVDVALGIVGNPELLFLDEPTTGFDPEARRYAWAVIKDLASGRRTILLTTHYLEEAEVLADRVGIIVSGRVVEVGTPNELRSRISTQAKISFAQIGPLAGQLLPELPGSVRVEDRTVTILSNSLTAIVQSLAGWSTSLGATELPDLQVLRPTLEDAYLEMVHKHGTEP
jgi:ABC-2 type transport system ATP-binding protein